MNTRRALQLDDLLVIEDDAAFADAACPHTGLPYWPQVRSVMLRMAMSDFLYDTPLDGSVSRGVPASRAMHTLARSVAHNAGLHVTGRARADVCIFSTGVANQMVDGRAFNRLSDHFALAAPARTVSVEEHFQWTWPFPRHNPRVLLHAPLQAANQVSARLALRARHLRAAGEVIAHAAARAQSHLDWRPGAPREAILVEMLARKMAGLPSQVHRYERFFARVRPKLALVIAACYGPASALLEAARQRGIASAEYQHGVISAGHDGYNVAPALAASPVFRRALPDRFLAYGDWWNRQFNLPLERTVVGNPHREQRVEALRARPAAQRRTLLILSDGTEFGLYAALAAGVGAAAQARGMDVVIRPHPLERSAVARDWAGKLGRATLDPNPDLYDSLHRAALVVSELSTGLFEGAGIADRLLLWNTPKSRFGFRTLPFASFDDAAQLAALLDDPHAGRLDEPQVQSIWASGWQARYRRVLAEAGVADV